MEWEEGDRGRDKGSKIGKGRGEKGKREGGEGRGGRGDRGRGK